MSTPKKYPRDYNEQQMRRYNDYRRQYGQYYTRATYVAVGVQACIHIAVVTAIACAAIPNTNIWLLAYMFVGAPVMMIVSRIFLYAYFYKLVDRWLDKKHGPQA